MFPTRREGGERGRERGQARPGPAPRRPLLPGTAPPRRARGSSRGPSPAEPGSAVPDWARLCSARLGPTRLSRTRPSVSEQRGQPHAMPTSRRDRPRPHPALWAQCRVYPNLGVNPSAPQKSCGYQGVMSIHVWVPTPHWRCPGPGCTTCSPTKPWGRTTNPRFPFLPPRAGPLSASRDPLLRTQIIAVLSEQNTTCICPFAPTKNDK